MNKLTSGIYKIENKKTGQIYIGQSKNIEKRFSKHCCISPVDMEIATQGKENFSFDILEEVEEQKLDERERFWIDGYGAYENDYHYNLTPGGSVFPEGVHKSKYTLWNDNISHYEKTTMFKQGNEEGLRPRKCFVYMFQSYYMPIGLFHDFISCEIINQLVDSFINN